MRIEKRGDGEGIYYSFVFYDTRTKKPIRITKEEIRKRFGHDITSEEEAKQCLKLLEAQLISVIHQWAANFSIKSRSSNSSFPLPSLYWRYTTP